MAAKFKTAADVLVRLRTEPSYGTYLEYARPPLPALP